jgi:hypothetical protein
MVTITTTDPQEALSYPDGGWAEWPFPADPGRIVQRDLDIGEYTGAGHNQIVPQRSCEPGPIVYKVCNGYWFFGRHTVEELRRDLRAMVRSTTGAGSCETPRSGRRGSAAAIDGSTHPSVAGPGTTRALPRG